jgi:hypothetical protein
VSARTAHTPPPLTPPLTVPPPVMGKSIDLRLKHGKVFYEVPGAKQFLPLTEDVQVPVGTTLDTTLGRVTLISATDQGGSIQHAWFYDGVFTVDQRKGNPLTTLGRAGPELSCSAKSSAVIAAAKKKPKTRKLWGDGSGAFSTAGQFSAATVRGTKWVVIDRCDGTLTRVVRGIVEVRDFARHKTIILKAGKQYLARRST